MDLNTATHQAVRGGSDDTLPTYRIVHVLHLQLVFGIGVIQIFHQRVLGGSDAQDGLLGWLLQLAADDQLVEDVVRLVCVQAKYGNTALNVVGVRADRLTLRW